MASQTHARTRALSLDLLAGQGIQVDSPAGCGRVTRLLLEAYYW